MTEIMLGTDVRAAVIAYELCEQIAHAAFMNAFYESDDGESGYSESEYLAHGQAGCDYLDRIEAGRLLLADVVRHDRLACWIVENPMREYPDEAIEVLKRLPMTRADIEHLAWERGWCEEAGYFLDLASAQGVL